MGTRIAIDRRWTRKLALADEGWQDLYMAGRKKTPERSRLTRIKAVAFARRQKTEVDEEPPDMPKLGDGPKAATTNTPPTGTPEIPEVSAPVADTKPSEPETRAAAGAPAPGEGAKAAWTNEPPVEIDIPKAAEPTPGRGRSATISMPPDTAIGAPPAMPAAPPARSAPTSGIEDPTFMPGPRDVPAGNPEDPAAAPGRVPPGDSRSLRKGTEFALVYRRSTYIVTRTGVVGTRGQWRVVEYPTSAAASHAYAKECSRFVSEGFSDYRD